MREYHQTVGLTQQALADRAGVTRQVVTQFDAYLYIEPPPSVLKALVSAYRDAQLPCTEQELRLAYYEGQKQIRRENRDLFIGKVAKSGEGEGTWLSFRKSVHSTQHGFCRILAFDTRLLQDYERQKSKKGGARGEKTRQNASPALWEALRDVLSEYEWYSLKWRCHND